MEACIKLVTSARTVEVPETLSFEECREIVQQQLFIRCPVFQYNYQSVCFTVTTAQEFVQALSHIKATDRQLVVKNGPSSGSYIQHLPLEVSVGDSADIGHSAQASVVIDRLGGSSEGTIFTGYQCMICGVCPIRTAMYTCPQCKEIALCSSCEERFQHPHWLLKHRQFNKHLPKK